MISVKTAVFTKLTADIVGPASLVGLLGGARIYYRQPPAAANDQFPRITFAEIFRTEDREIPLAGILLQVDFWSKSNDLNDQLAARAFSLLHNKPLVISDGIVRSVLLQDDREVTEPDAELRHRAQTYRLSITH